MYVQCMLKLILIKINVSTMPLKETHTAFMLTILEYLVMALSKRMLTVALCPSNYGQEESCGTDGL